MRAEGDVSRAGAQHTETRFAVLRRQLPFAAVVFVAVLVALVSAPELLLDGDLLVPLVCAVGATLLAVVVPWPRLPRWATTVVPLLNMLAIALAQHHGLPAGGLLLLPVLVLARTETYGLVLAIAGGTLASWAPTLLASGPLELNGAVASDLVLRPTVIVAAAVMLFLVERRSAARLTLLAGQSALIEEVLNDTTADRELLETVLNTITTQVVVLDRDGTIRRLNRAAAGVYGEVMVPGHSAQDVARTLPTPEQDREQMLPTLEQDPAQTGAASPLVRAGRGEEFSEEIWWTRVPAGDRIAYRASAASFDGGQGGTVLALENLTRELEALARREEFVSAVSHELRTPLTSVVGYLDLVLEDQTLSADGRRNLEIADRNAHRLEILIENLLVAARGNEPVTPGPVDLGAIVRDVVEDQTPRAREARADLRVVGPRECLVLGTSDRVTQVVDNLLSNAIKYSRPNSEVTVTVDDDGARTQRGMVRLEVRDRGIGILAEDLAHVFDRFYRARAVREGPVQGTGLGLPITRGIVEDMGGTISLDSVVGEGTRVTVELPLGEPR